MRWMGGQTQSWLEGHKLTFMIILLCIQSLPLYSALLPQNSFPVRAQLIKAATLMMLICWHWRKDQMAVGIQASVHWQWDRASVIHSAGISPWLNRSCMVDSFVSSSRWDLWAIDLWHVGLSNVWCEGDDKDGGDEQGIQIFEL